MIYVRQCPICFAPTDYYIEESEGVVYEEDELCSKCKMYGYHFLTGGTHEQYGCIDAIWSYKDDPPTARGEWLLEARRLWRHPDGRGFFCGEWRACCVARGIFADWCCEQGLNHTEQALRSDVHVEL